MRRLVWRRLLDSSPFPSDRKGREAALASLEEDLASVVRGRLKAIVLKAYDAFLNTLTAAGDASTLDSIPNEWHTFVVSNLGNQIGDVYLRGAVTAWARAIAADVVLPEGFPELWSGALNDSAVVYQLSAENRLIGVGDRLWADIKHETVRAVTDNATTEELKGRIEDLTNFSEFRADTIARTETHLAATMGDRAGATALGRYGPVEHVWVAVQDGRTREDHLEAHDQVQSFNDEFIVGGERLLHPGDGGPEQSINCRCWEDYLFAGDTRPDGSVVPD